MNNLKVAIIEDEVPAARLLHSMLKRLRPQWGITDPDCSLAGGTGYPGVVIG